MEVSGEEKVMKLCSEECTPCCDYDGEATVKGLKRVVDELVGMANNARNCLWDGKLFGIHGNPDEEE